MLKRTSSWTFFILVTACAIHISYARTFKPPSQHSNYQYPPTNKPFHNLKSTTNTPEQDESARDISVGPCIWAIGRKCPDKDIKFYLYTRNNPIYRQNLYIDETLEKSNITDSFFNPKHPTKIIIHGYNSDMFLHPLIVMREEYMAKSDYNLIYVDWSVLSPGPCYISAVHNTKHAGACVAQLVERILETGSADMHVIGFSLGAQLANYIAKNLGSFLLPRITGLDPAMPLFITAGKDDKLDPSDAVYVDVMHTNAMVQGKLERCGHADFYMNGGIMQPGCYSAGTNPFACSHQRAPAYFLESIRSAKGFWGWACSSYIMYMLGMCPPTNYLLEAGENIRWSTKGMFFINTNDTQPYALGKWTDLPTLGVKRKPTITIAAPPQNTDPFIRQIDEWGKLDSQFNNLETYPEESSDNPNKAYWNYFTENKKETSSSFSSENYSHFTNEGKTNASIEEQDFEDLEEEGSGQKDNTQYHQYLSDVDEKPALKWTEYRKNLTEGFIENSIFQLPHIRGR